MPAVSQVLWQGSQEYAFNAREVRSGKHNDCVSIRAAVGIGECHGKQILDLAPHAFRP